MVMNRINGGEQSPDAGPPAGAAPAQQKVGIFGLPGMIENYQLALIVPEGKPTPTRPPAELMQLFVDHIAGQAVGQVVPRERAAALQGLLIAVRGSTLPCSVGVHDPARLAAWQAGANAVMQLVEQHVQAGCMGMPAPPPTAPKVIGS